MGGAFENSLPDKVFDVLQTGDIFFVQTFGSVISWAIMYFTRSQVSHVAFYLRDRKIVHATLSGVVTEPVEVLFNSNTRILPCAWDDLNKHREGLEEMLTSSTIDNFYYDWGLVVRKALRIIFGWDWYYFRWTFIVDAALLVLTLDLPFIVFFHSPVVSLLLPLYVLTVFVSRIFSKKLPPSQGNPGEMLNFLYASGQGKFILDAYHVGQQLKSERRSQ